MSFSLAGYALMLGASLILLSATGQGVGIVHGQLREGGCMGNVPINHPEFACSYSALANEPILFETRTGLIVGTTISNADGSYGAILPAGHYSVVSPRLGTSFQGGVDVYAWWSFQQNTCLCVEAP